MRISRLKFLLAAIGISVLPLMANADTERTLIVKYPVVYPSDAILKIQNTFQLFYVSYTGSLPNTLSGKIIGTYCMANSTKSTDEEDCVNHDKSYNTGTVEALPSETIDGKSTPMEELIIHNIPEKVEKLLFISPDNADGTNSLPTYLPGNISILSNPYTVGEFTFTSNQCIVNAPFIDQQFNSVSPNGCYEQ